ncbi:MAG TPA: DUF1361 domain-containing protein [Patescibacteria group bacterium]|nr:DUF1361 domain-containing protein [Patescibacteria group bacterium]
MSFNILLALLPVVIAVVMYKSQSLITRVILGVVWLGFLPNTVYLLTDIYHFFEDMQKISGVYILLDLFMYLVLVVLGIITFVLALNPFERMIAEKFKKKNSMKVIYFVNFLVGFGMVLGRILRINSWEIVTNTKKVAYYGFFELRSWELMAMVLIFSVLAQVIYMQFKGIVAKIS